MEIFTFFVSSAMPPPTSSSSKKTKLASLISAIKSSDRTKTKNLSDDITFDINSSVECESDGEEDFPLQVALDEHFTKETEDSFACFSTICSHDHLNPDKDFWGDGKTALQRAAERCDAYASFALLERKASVEATNRRDGNKTAIDYARGMKVTSEEEKENKNRVIRLLESERDGTDAVLE